MKKYAALCLSAFAVAGAAVLSGCSDASRAAFNNLGEPAKVKVYSGGKLIYEGVSTGKIKNEENSNGYYFNDKCIQGDNKLVEVSGDVVISRDDLSCPKNREFAPN
ncbi:MAG: hypothetical protein HYS17_06800 [Micavibrio aeruginosavorus]|uniref:Lipoprotein n=1 Tax=Micavibrio aeruginosavorus TaxID=349221 RepID=A0A7T5R0F9_9BACT|nr:MAG: hypothetical protein HYS17_06800 [Micavibrio aeruginosavorus]